MVIMIFMIFFKKSFKMGPTVMRRYVHRLDMAIPTLYYYICEILSINQVNINASRELSKQNLPSSIIAQIELSMLDVFLGFLQPLRQRIAVLRRAKLLYVFIKFIVSEYESFRFSLSFSASFWMVFVEPGASLLCPTSRILCYYFNVLTLP